MRNQKSTKILRQLRMGFAFLTVLFVSLGLLAATKIKGISESIQQVNDNDILITEIVSLIDDNVYESTLALKRYVDTEVGLREATQAVEVIDRLLIGELLRAILEGLYEPELASTMNLLQQATRSYAEDIKALEKKKNISPDQLNRLLFWESKVVSLAGTVKKQAWKIANNKIQAVERLSQETTWLIFISALIVAVGSITVVAASFVLVRDFTTQQEALLERYQKEAELERNLREAEVKVLHSQINPHFIFNTLNVISSMELAKCTEQIPKVVKALSDLLRYGLKFAGKLVSLSSEIDVVEKYLLIQKERFGERLRYSLKIEPALVDVELPAMTLQPLVENALIHGIEPTEDGGIVRVEAYEQAGDVVILINDNGQGCDPNVLKKMINDGKVNNHLGIELVYKRLKYYLGDRLQMTIFTNWGKGLRVQIRILPSEMQENEISNELAVFPLHEG